MKIVWVVLWLFSSIAQPTTIEVTAHQQTLVYAGPSETYQQVGVLNAGIPIIITERNTLGNWLHIQMYNRRDVLLLEGWIISGALNLPATLSYADIPVNDILPDANPDNIRSQSQSALYAQPVIPIIHPDMIAVFERGQGRGYDAQTITKVGDSLTANDQFITLFNRPDYVLGPYDYMEPTLQYYRDGIPQKSIASQIGMSTYVVFDPLWARDDSCQPNESPLLCEYRLTQPSIAFILFGPNDVRSITEEEYRTQMEQIVTITLDADIIPVLMTFSTHPDEEFYWQSINFNLELIDLAEDYNVPLINLWAAAQPLPDYGLDVDLVHMAHSGFDYLKYDTGHEARYGVSLQNLLVLRTLHAIRLELNMN